MINLLAELKSRQGDRPVLALRLWLVALALLVIPTALALAGAFFVLGYGSRG